MHRHALGWMVPRTACVFLAWPYIVEAASRTGTAPKVDLVIIWQDP
jgi:hypothetical protein